MVLRRVNVPDPEFDGFVQGQMEKWKVPGLTMAIVHGDSTWSKVRMPVPDALDGLRADLL